jgi:rare lipoprotein A
MARTMLNLVMNNLTFLLFMILVASFFSVAPVHAADDSPPQTVASEQKESPAIEQSKATIGIATYYHNRYSGRRTSSGAIYNPRKMTAASPSIPLGTRVKVTNLGNNKSVVVMVNDRMKKRNFELIDLSRVAARKLGFVRAGSARVCMVALEEE